MRFTGKVQQLSDGLSVRRLLPDHRKRSVGPWVFVDHFGPADVSPHAMDVRPHPHIGLATVTYLYEGAVRHRDQLGSDIVIRPGAVNLMVAGKGIVHSERSEGYAGPMHGLQLWLALPADEQEQEPAFHHVPSSELPQVLLEDGVSVRVVMGSIHGMEAPVPSPIPVLFVDVELDAGAVFTLPESDEERAILPVQGTVRIGSASLDAGEMLLVTADGPTAIEAVGAVRLAILGGPAIEPRKMFWNFVHTDSARIDEASAAWKAGEFAKVPGDEEAFIPLPQT